MPTAIADLTRFDTSQHVALSLASRRADQSADNRADCRRAKRDPSGVPAAVMDVVNDMMPRRRRRAMRTMSPPMMRRGNRRASRQNHTRHKNRECLDDLVHVTPTFPDILPLHKVRRPSSSFLTGFSTPDSAYTFMQITSSSSEIARSDPAITPPIIVRERPHSLNAAPAPFTSSSHFIRNLLHLKSIALTMALPALAMPRIASTTPV